MKIGVLMLDLRVSALFCTALMLGACATRAPEPESEPTALASSPWAVASSSAVKPARWQHREFPGKRQSLYRYARVDGRDTMLVRADFVKSFGELPGALVAIGIMTDTDNTQSTTQAWYGPVRLVRAADPAATP